MKILFFIRTLHGGGAQKIMTKLANIAKKKGYDIVIVTLCAEGDFSTLIHPGIKIIELRYKRMLFSFSSFAQVIKAEKPHIIISTEVAVNIFTIISKWMSGVGSSTKVIIREALSPSLAIKYNEFASTRYGYMMAKYFYPSADHVIAIAEAMAPDLESICGVSKDKLTVVNINPCVDTRLLAIKNDAAPHHWFSSSSIPVVVCVGRLDFQKGFDDAIKAVVAINKKMKIRLIIVGEGDERSNLEKLISENGASEYITLFGNTNNPYAFMSHSSLFLMPSRYEGLGNVLIEALACGAKCIAYDCPVGPSETLNYGEYGRLVEANNISALENAIVEELAKDYDREKIVGRGAQYTAENSFALYERVIYKVLNCTNTNVRE